MSQKLTQEELQQFQEYRSESSRFAAILGEYTYKKTLIEFELEVIKAGIRENAQEQTQFLRALGEKYGDGSINFETGEIVPVESK
jgi:hypothetical protein